MSINVLCFGTNLCTRCGWGRMCKTSIDPKTFEYVMCENPNVIQLPLKSEHSILKKLPEATTSGTTSVTY